MKSVGSTYRVLLLFVAVALVALPAVVIAASGSGSSGVTQQTTFWTDEAASINDTSFRSVPDMGDQDVVPDCQNVAVDVSGDMSQGQALVRVVSQSVSDREVAEPGPVLFAARGSNSFTFLVEGFAGNLSVEWRRAGDQRAIAQNFSAHVIGAQNCG